jgi:hypothetical protein
MHNGFLCEITQLPGEHAALQTRIDMSYHKRRVSGRVQAAPMSVLSCTHRLHAFPPHHQKRRQHVPIAAQSSDSAATCCSRKTFNSSASEVGDQSSSGHAQRGVPHAYRCEDTQGQAGHQRARKALSSGRPQAGGGRRHFLLLSALSSPLAALGALEPAAPPAAGDCPTCACAPDWPHALLGWANNRNRTTLGWYSLV